MNKIEEFKKQAEEFICESDLTPAFDLVWDRLSAKSTYQSNFRVLEGRWKDITHAQRIGTITFAEVSQHKSQVREAFLSFIKNLPDADLDTIRNPDKIAARLFILTPTDTSEAAMHQFFPFEYFREVEFDREESYKTLASAGMNTVVIFDHYNHEDVEVNTEQREAQLEKLRWLLRETTCPIVWFGDRHEMVSIYSKRIGAANFPFTLYARIREMLDFLKYYQGKKD
jgi:hypothetical protein